MANGAYLEAEHNSQILRKDYGFTTLGIGYEYQVNRFSIEGKLATPVGTQDRLRDKQDWKTGDPVGSITIRYRLFK